jgi:NAD(P)-dependent dehydrogenase (short-subunit alcohol dehydrogenase family)
MGRRAGQVAVVSGASSGLGRRLALDLAAEGATVIGVARRADALAEVEADLRAASPHSTTVALDVGDTDAYEALLGEIERERGRVDVLFNGAAFERAAGAEQVRMDLVVQTMQVNFFAVAAGTLAVLPGMLARGEGVVVNVSSDHGRAPAPGTPAYSASKGAVSAFTESIALEVADRGVRLHVLYPGWVPTPLGRGVVEQGMPMPPRAVRRTEEQISRLVRERMGGRAIELNAARLATLAPVVRALAPPVYRQQMRAQSMHGKR